MFNSPLEHCFRVNDVWVNPIDNSIERNGVVVAAAPKVIQILQCLAFNPNRLVTFDEIIDFAWAGKSINLASLYQQMALLRRLLQDSKDEPVFIKTYPRQGYRLLAEVEFEFARATSADGDAQQLPADAVAAEAWVPWGYGVVAASVCMTLVLMAYQVVLPAGQPQGYSRAHLADARVSGTVSEALQQQRQRVFAVPVFYFPGEYKYKGLENAVADITRFHLESQVGAQVSLVPIFSKQERAGGAKLWRDKVAEQIRQGSQIAYIVEPSLTESEHGDFIGFDILNPLSEKVIKHYQTPIHINSAEVSLKRLEKQLISALEQLG